MHAWWKLISATSLPMKDWRQTGVWSYTMPGFARVFSAGIKSQYWKACLSITGGLDLDVYIDLLQTRSISTIM